MVVNGIGEGSKGSIDLENVYDRTKNVETTDSDYVGDDGAVN